MFRFNNPEEVRKKRDRLTAAKSSLHISVSAGDLEAATASPSLPPDSPTSSTGPDDMDYAFAKREANLARLGLDPSFDNLPDEDLNKLFEKITKVKSLRDNTKSRPESRLSLMDDIWSESGRAIPSELTDDTSVDAWAGVQSAGQASPSLDTPMKEAPMQLDSQLMAISETSEADDLKEEKEHMERQMKIVRAQMRRLLDARARGETDAELEMFEPTIYSAKQLRLIRKVLDKWRAHRSFSMAESVLSNAFMVKEANVIRCAVFSCFCKFPVLNGTL